MFKISPIDEAKNKKNMKNYIFDEKLVQKQKQFTQLKFNNSFGHGLLLPKEIDLKDKKGDVVGKDQIWSPVIITDRAELLEATKEIEILYNIKFETIPSNLNLRWSLDSIKSWLEGDDLVPDLTPKEVFEDVKKLYENFCFFRESAWYKVNAIWDIGTYLFMLFNNYPIKEERGLQSTGKTKTMQISKNISCNSTDIMINPSEATLFRETHEKRPTKYIDEAEKLFSFKKGQMESDNRVELINGSYSKGSTIPRIEKVGNKFVCVYYNVYSPTRIGSINGLYGATESRTITQIHTRSPDTDKRGEREPSENDPEWRLIRDNLYLFSLKYWKKIEDCYNNKTLYENIKLKKRDLQIWKPLLAIAEIIDHKLFLEIVNFAEKISLHRKEDFITEGSWDYRILSIIKEILDSGNEIIRPKNIKEKYIQKFSNETEKTPHEKTITTRLDNLGFKELRLPKDMHGVSYQISKENYHIIVSPISDLSNYSSYSSYSSYSLINTKKDMTNSNNSMTENDESQKTRDEYDGKDEYDEVMELNYPKEKKFGDDIEVEKIK